MKSRKTFSTMLTVCAVILVLAVVVGLSGVFNAIGTQYANAEQYSAGGADIEAPVRNLDIHWTNGSVNIVYDSGSSVRLQETSDKPISEDMQMRWWLDGDTLRVQYEKSGLRLFRFIPQEKALTITLPEGTAFDHVRVDATSGDLNLPALRAESLALHTTSGNINAAAESQTVAVSATSGDIALKLGETKTVDAAATSGSIGIEAAAVDALKAGATSGGISLNADRTGHVNLGTTSGNIYLDVRDADSAKIGATSGSVNVRLARLRSLEIGVTAGNITLALPETPGFTARVSTTAGTFDYDMPLNKQGGLYVCGDGTADVKVSTTAGDVHITGLENQQ